MMHVAAVQLDCQWENRAASHARVRRLLESVSLPANTLVVLPEMFDVGFSTNTAATDPGEPSESERFLKEIAAEKNVCVLAGVVARAGDGKLANEAVAFCGDGTQLVRYRKMQPFTVPGEHVHYPAGHSAQTFEWQGVKIAPFVCYDLRFPELFRKPAIDGAEFFIVVANWPEKRSEHWVRLLQARAIENQAFVLGVNRCGTDPGFKYDGRSCLFDPHGIQLFQADAAEQVLIGHFNPDDAGAWRAAFPALRDAKHL
jgi:omega-amidase